MINTRVKAIAMLGLMTMISCSYVFIPEPASGHFTRGDDCVIRPIVPRIDTVLAVGAGVSGGAMAYNVFD